LIERNSAWILGSLSIVCFIAACITMWSSMKERDKWQQVDARISASDIVNYRRWNTTYYRFQAEFTYIARGRRLYVPFSFPESSSNLAEIEAQRNFVHRLRAHRVFYNPADPADMLFELNHTRFFILPLSLTIGAIGFGVALLADALRWSAYFCPSCGTGATETHRFCTHCGLAIPARKGKMLGDSVVDKLRQRWYQPSRLDHAPKRWGRTVGLALAGTSVILACIATGQTVAHVWHLLEWRTATANAAATRVAHSHDGEGRLVYKAIGTFRHEFEGRQYTAQGESVFFSRDFPWVRAEQGKFAPRTEHKVRVHPTDPSRVVFGNLGLALLSGDNADLLEWSGICLAAGGLCIGLWRPAVACPNCKYRVRRHYAHCPYCGCNAPLRAASQSA
jgi:hypothetical protein